MMFAERRRFIIFGGLFGAWLGGVYAFVTHLVNWVAVPEVPIMPPGGSLSGYLLQYIFIGGLLGVICAAPENRWAGLALGGAAASFLLAATAVRSVWGLDSFAPTLILVILAFLPMAILMIPLLLVVRLAVDAQRVDPERPYLWARRILIPGLLTIVAMLVGLLALYSPAERRAFRYTDTLVREGLSTNRYADLPVPLKDVTGFLEQADGPFSLSYSDRVDTFMGPVPAGDELSQFLIITHFQNGFTFACVFSPNRSAPNCAPY